MPGGRFLEGFGKSVEIKRVMQLRRENLAVPVAESYKIPQNSGYVLQSLGGISLDHSAVSFPGPNRSG